MQSRKAGFPCATRARKREPCVRRYVSRDENDSDRKFSKSIFFQSCSGNHFCPRFMVPCSLLAENIFRFFEVRTYPSIHHFGRSDHVWVNISDFIDDRFILKRTLPSFTWCDSIFIKMIFNLTCEAGEKHR